MTLKTVTVNQLIDRLKLIAEQHGGDVPVYVDRDGVITDPSFVYVGDNIDSSYNNLPREYVLI